jgi:hypothetical protein
LRSKVPYATGIDAVAKKFNRLKGYVPYCI